MTNDTYPDLMMTLKWTFLIERKHALVRVVSYLSPLVYCVNELMSHFYLLEMHRTNNDDNAKRNYKQNYITDDVREMLLDMYSWLTTFRIGMIPRHQTTLLKMENEISLVSRHFVKLIITIIYHILYLGLRRMDLKESTISKFGIFPLYVLWTGWLCHMM